jgi:hypothetical protein
MPGDRDERQPLVVDAHQFVGDDLLQRGLTRALASTSGCCCGCCLPHRASRDTTGQTRVVGWVSPLRNATSGEVGGDPVGPLEFGHAGHRGQLLDGVPQFDRLGARGALEITGPKKLASSSAPGWNVRIGVPTSSPVRLSASSVSARSHSSWTRRRRARRVLVEPGRRPAVLVPAERVGGCLVTLLRDVQRVPIAVYQRPTAVGSSVSRMASAMRRPWWPR